MNSSYKYLTLSVPQALIVWWAASNFIYSNRYEYYDMTVVALFYFLIFLIGSFLTFIMLKIFSKYNPAVLIVSYVTLFFILLTPSVRELLDPYMRYRYTLCIVILFAICLSYFAIKIMDHRKVISRFAILFLFLSAVPTSQHLYFLAFAEKLNDTTKTTFKGPAFRNPNVYFIILDAYIRSDILKQNLDFDNSKFMSFLKDRNFFNAEDSFVAYPSTIYSMLTTFRMRYAKELDPNLWSKRFKSDTFENFRALGYDLHFMSQFRGIVPCPEKVTCHSDEPKSDLLYIGRLGATLIKTIPLLENLLFAIAPQRFDYEINEVSDLHEEIRSIKLNEPFFFYAHILMPHSPYIRDAECKSVDVRGSGDFKSFRWYNRHRYINFLKCGNNQMTEVISTLIKKDPEAIIIIQGDHGAWFTYNRYSGSDTIPEPGPEPWRVAAMSEAYANLNVLRVPLSCRDKLYPEMSPVNTFRFVFACITNREPDYLPDKSFLIDREKELIKVIRQGGNWLF